jgi:hypothetical protein
MKNSKNQEVQNFLKDLSIMSEEKYKIIQELRKLVFNHFPKTNERIMYGGIMFSLEEDFGGVFASKNHVSFEFGKGFRMDDPYKNLEGSGKYRRHLKIKTFSDIKSKNVDFYIKQVLLIQ